MYLFLNCRKYKFCAAKFDHTVRNNKVGASFHLWTFMKLLKILMDIFFPPNERMTEKSVNKNTRCNVL